MSTTLRRCLVAVALAFAPLATAPGAQAQDNYEVQVYGAFGPFVHIDPCAAQEHQCVGAVNVNVSLPREINFGVGAGSRRSAERRIVKLILRRCAGG